MESNSVNSTQYLKSWHRFSSENLKPFIKNLQISPKTPSSHRRLSLTPQQVLNLHSEFLSEYELSEILNYKRIYFFGNKGVCKFNGRFSSKQGIYRGINGDHIQYRYEILKVLGRGSFGVVFKCKDHKTSDLVALKVIKCKEKYRKAGQLESYILSKLAESTTRDHNAFVEKIRAFEFRGHFCIVFELLYCTLYNFLQEKNSGLDITIVKRITIQILQGLKQLHCLKYLHCDLKPDNIMLQYENKSKVKIIDLGSACYTFNKAVPRYIQTRYYRAPEIILGVNYDSSIDYWSLGCVMVEMITGNTLFLARDEEHLISLIVGIIGEPPAEFLAQARKADLYFVDGRLKKNSIAHRRLEEILVGVCYSCIEFIKKCLVWDPKDRMNFEIGLNHSWIKGRGK